MFERISREHFDAVLFDLDGVLTRTGEVHASAWKQMFDGFFEDYVRKSGVSVRPFGILEDYLPIVDGKPRLDAIRAVLASRRIRIAEGTADDAPELETVHALGNRKNRLVLRAIASGEIRAYGSSVVLVKHLRELGIRTAVVSSSKSCQAVLEAVGISHLFEVRIDAVVAQERRLPGKPAPDTFLEAARELGVDPSRAVVVEDAIAGVKAGRAGAFGLVIGVARHDNSESLRAAGADFVVDDLGQLMPKRV